jgi:hypothetical protein
VKFAETNTPDEERWLLPAVRDLLMMRQLRCTYQELQDTPEERLEVWRAVWQGEDGARRARARAGR